MIGEEPSQRYWILSLPVDNCWTKCVICILKFVVFQILGKLIFLRKIYTRVLDYFLLYSSSGFLGICLHAPIWEHASTSS